MSLQQCFQRTCFTSNVPGPSFSLIRLNLTIWFAHIHSLFLSLNLFLSFVPLSSSLSRLLSLFFSIYLSFSLTYNHCFFIYVILYLFNFHLFFFSAPNLFSLDLTMYCNNNRLWPDWQLSSRLNELKNVF